MKYEANASGGKETRLKKYTSILFDLDGTLTDSGPGIIKGVQYALRKFDIDCEDPGELTKFIGPPLTDSFIEYYQFDNDMANLALQYYREYYSDIGIFENSVYAGIDGLLHDLHKSNYLLYIATSKPTVYARKVCDHFGISRYFNDIIGSDIEKNLSNKTGIINEVISRHTLDVDETVMIGDREHDVKGAINNKIDCIGVGYGYGSKEELLSSGALYYADTVSDIRDMLVIGNT